MKALLKSYSDSDNEEENASKPGETAGAKETKQPIKIKKVVAQESKQSEAKATTILLQPEIKPQPENAESDTKGPGNILDDGDFIKVAKNNAISAHSREPIEKLPKKRTQREIDPDADPFTKEFLSAIPEPAKKKAGVALGKPQSLPKRIPERQHEDDIADKEEELPGQGSVTVQLPKSHLEYSSERVIQSFVKPLPSFDPKSESLQSELKKHAIPESRDWKNAEKNEVPVIDVDEAELHDESWKFNYLKNLPEREKMEKMQHKLTQFAPGRTEKSSNHITYLAYQDLKRQITNRSLGGDNGKARADSKKKLGF